MKIYNQKLNKVMDATPALFRILQVKGWVQVPEIEPEDTKVIEFESQPLDELVPDEPLSEDTSYLEEQENPEPEQDKTLEVKPKNKKRK